MAENIVAGLFGLTPQMFQNQQYQQDLNRGISMAQLSPGAAAQAGLQASVGQLGRGIAGAMGIEDPQLKMISARNTIAQQIDQTNPESILKGAQMLAQMGDQQGAMALAQYARQAESDVAQTKQRLAAALASEAAAKRERLQGVDKDIQIANEIATLEDSLSQIENLPADPERTRAKNLLTTRLAELRRLTAKGEKDKPIASGTDRDAYSREMYDNKIYVDLTPTQKAAVNKRIQDEEGTRAEKGAPKTILPGQPVPTKDWMDFTQKVLSSDPIMQRTSTILSDAPSAIEIIRNSRSNDFAAASLPTSIALLTGQGKNMSNADVDRFARTGGLDDRLAQDAVKFFTGRTTEVKKDQAEKFAIALYRGALIERKRKLESAAEEFGYTESPNYKVALRNIDSQLAQFKLVKKGEKAPTTTKTGNPLVDKWLSTDAEK
jgi:hypothetical protein